MSDEEDIYVSDCPQFALTLVDVGGTKSYFITVGLSNDGSIIPDILFSESFVSTPVGLKDDFFDSIAREIKNVQDNLPGNVTLLPIVGYGTPGKLVDGKISPGTAISLGLNKWDFDNVEPEKELSKRLGQQIFSFNDALSQLMFGIKFFLDIPNFREKFLGKKIGYIGPGTGLGGGFASVSDDGVICFHTDGHVFDIIIPGFEKQSHIEFMVDDETFKIPVGPQHSKCEDLLSGRAIRQVMIELDHQLMVGGRQPLFLNFGEENDTASAKILNQKILEVLSPDNPAYIVAEKIGVFEGDVLGRLIKAVFQGDITKINSENQWSDEDKKNVVETTTFLIGGSIGTVGKLSEIILESTRDYLIKELPEIDFDIIPLPPNTSFSGAIGVGYLIPQDIILEKIHSSSHSR